MKPEKTLGRWIWIERKGTKLLKLQISDKLSCFSVLFSSKLLLFSCLFLFHFFHFFHFYFFLFHFFHFFHFFCLGRTGWSGSFPFFLFWADLASQAACFVSQAKFEEWTILPHSCMSIPRPQRMKFARGKNERNALPWYCFHHLPNPTKYSGWFLRW